MNVIPRKTLDLLRQWQSADDLSRTYREQELSLRLQIIDKYSTWKDPLSEGTETIPLSDIITLKVQHGVNYKLIPDNLRDALARIAKLDGDVIAERLVEYKPRLILGEYRRLSPKATVLIEKHLEKTAATKSLKMG